MAEATHAEYEPGAVSPLILPAACPVEGWRGDGPRLSGRMKILVAPDSLAFQIYGTAEIEEAFNCSYELNPAYEAALMARGLRVAGRGVGKEVRIAELSDHRFFIATLYQPQLGSTPAAPHPLITAYLEAALAFSRDRAGA